jgi:hypothetical protein
MRPGVFFSYFGGKFMRAPHYPPPRYSVVVEPFAGAAGYSVRHQLGKRAILFDTSPYIAGVWSYLIAATRAEIMALPLMEPGQSVDDLSIPQEARWLLGFWVNQGSAVPKKTMGGRASNRAIGTWGEGPRARIAAQVHLIRAWEIHHGDYSEAPDAEASWFIDPPYVAHPDHYPGRAPDFGSLAGWCRSRRGQVMVCETLGADWLPFQKVTTVAGSSHRVTTEVLWENGDGLPLFGAAA